MSYPPRPPMGMPPMGGMGYGYSPMGMMPPMGMGMMPPGGMMRPSVSTQPAQPKKQVQKLIPQEIPKDSEEKPPVTTVFVGNITERAPDQMMRTMLQRCGNVLSWKRVQGASGKLQAFGFCEYEDPEATLRCIRLLNEWPIADKKLVAKVDAKTKTLLDEYKEKKAKKLGKAGEDENINNDELQQREDRVAKAGLDAIMREYQRELSKPVKSEAKKGTKSHSSDEKAKDKEKEKKKTSDPIKDVGLDDMVLEEDQKALINREINRFRDAHKGEEVKEIEIDGIDKDENRIRRMQRELERERQKMKAYAEEALKRERERAEMKRAQPPKSRSRSRSRSRERIRERPGERSRESREREREWRERERLREKEDEEEAYERKRLERKLREKEAAYQERLKNWEQRERKKTRDYEKDKEKEQEKKEDENREARRLKEFLEDYDDERDDPKYYKGSALTRRLKEREKEMEADARDRAREKEEIEEIRQKLTEEGHPDVELKMAEIEKERDEHLQPRLHEQGVEEDEEEEDEVVEEEQDDTSNEQEDAQVQIVEGPAPRQDSPSTDGDNDDDEPPPRRHELSSDSEDSHQESSPEHYIGPATQQETETRKTVFTAVKNGPQDSPNTESQNTAKRKKMTVGEVFNQDEEDMDKSKKRKLVPLDYSDEEKAAIGPMKKAATAEEKRKLIKNLIERIPTAKDDLFAFPLDWTMVDSHLMDKRIKPWVNKKIVEYIGEEEPTLTEFICQKVILHSTPQVILNDVAMVLDEEAEVFVVKMWRLLIYETEAKKLGLVK